MGFVEAVTGKLLHEIEDFFDLLLWQSLGLGALDEALALRGHLLGLLLSHRASQNIGFAQRIAGQAIGNLHHLFLIHDDAVGFL